MGNVSYTPGKAEQKSLLYKRSIYVSKNIKAGEKFSPDNIKVIRPADGLHPRYFESIMGKRSPVDIKAGTPLKQNLIKAK